MLADCLAGHRNKAQCKRTYAGKSMMAGRNTKEELTKTDNAY